MSNFDSKNDDAWEKLFKKHHILDKIASDGQFIITAKEINEYREARLMTKFDHRRNLPTLFHRNKLAILPLTRGSYTISHYQVYHKFEENESPIIEVPYPSYIQSINWEQITSESTAINVAYISNMLADFIGEEGLVPTVNGRMSSDQFSFDIFNQKSKTNHHLQVKNSQIEIDGGFEGFDSLSLIEAKNSLSDDFLIRQLYYPFRLWKNKVHKRVRPVFLTYSNGIFSLYEYQFTDESNYNSIALLKANRYALKQDPIEIDDIVDISQTISFVEEPELPFPQANSFLRVINLCEILLERNYMTNDDITSKYDFDERQTDYYTNAGRYLGLIEKDRLDGNIIYKLTKLGYSVMNSVIRERNLKLVRLILQHKVFHKIFKYYLTNSNFPEPDVYVSIMKDSNLYNIVKHSTYIRRSSTITNWINWIFSLIRD